MIDLRLLRENPNLIQEGLKSRGMDVDLGPLQKLCKDLKELEEQRNSLQAQGNSIGKEVGQKIKKGLSQSSEEISKLRIKGNQIKKQVGLIEEQEKSISQELEDQLHSLPNIPDKDCPDGKSEKENKEIRRWGEIKENDQLKEHWEIAHKLCLWDTEKSETLKMDLWVKEMPINDMKLFFYQNLVSLGETYFKATNDNKSYKSIKKFSKEFAEEIELKSIK